MINVPWQQCSI